MACILYLHRITDNRMAGAPRENLERFKSLCGNMAIPQIILVTTMWSMVDQKTADARLRQLEDTFWKQMIKDGCKVEKFKDSQRSALLISGSNGAGRVILTEEIIEKHRKLLKLKEDREAADRKLKEFLREHDNSYQISQTDKVVVVMGPTGAGKSTVSTRRDRCFCALYP